jgi:hypothetical protein
MSELERLRRSLDELIQRKELAAAIIHKRRHRLAYSITALARAASFAQSDGHVPHHVYRNVPVPA